MLRSSLPSAAKKIVWNIKYGLLGYGHLEAPTNAIQYVRDNVDDASAILELGCGWGSMLRALRKTGCMSYYCGVDIAGRAIEVARGHGDQRSAWVVSDIESFRSPFRWKAILLIESVYYIHIQQLPSVLSRLRDMLVDDGFILVRIHDTAQHQEYVRALERLAPGGCKIDSTLYGIPRSGLSAEN